MFLACTLLRPSFLLCLSAFDSRQSLTLSRGHLIGLLPSGSRGSSFLNSGLGWLLDLCLGADTLRDGHRFKIVVIVRLLTQNRLLLRDLRNGDRLFAG